MNTIIITSSITFVPKNYRDFLSPLALNSHVKGIIIFDNLNLDLLFKALLLIITFSAPRLGIQLLKNFFSPNSREAAQFYLKNGKCVLITKNLNHSQTYKFLIDCNTDLIINARTRVYFKKQLLALPKIGCLNIHHGLLPEQRGLMCDFWAHLLGMPKGFSIHRMTRKIDDGEIVYVKQVDGNRDDYLQSLHLSSHEEYEILNKLLNEISSSNAIYSQENMQNTNVKYYSNPNIFDFYKLQLKGVKI